MSRSQNAAALDKLLEGGELNSFQQALVLHELEHVASEPPLSWGRYGCLDPEIRAKSYGAVASYLFRGNRLEIRQASGALFEGTYEALAALARHILAQRDAAHRAEGESVDWDPKLIAESESFEAGEGSPPRGVLEMRDASGQVVQLGPREMKE